MRWWKRYEPILEAKPVSGVVVIKDLIAKELVELYQAFPPPEHTIAWEDPVLKAKFAGRMHELPRLDVALVDVLSQILVFDLAHDVDAIDHLMRNNHHRTAAPSQNHVDALLLLWRVVMEHLEQRKEDTQGLLRRSDLTDIVVGARTRFRQATQAAN